MILEIKREVLFDMVWRLFACVIAFARNSEARISEFTELAIKKLLIFFDCMRFCKHRAVHNIRTITLSQLIAFVGALLQSLVMYCMLQTGKLTEHCQVQKVVC